jgi:glycosyltransferase involved in cell wall biosynthesis
MTLKTILVVIPTFNRKDLIGLTSGYLKRIDFDPGTFSFVISDDCSTEYGLAFLQEAYSALPNAKFMRTSRHSDAITHMWVLLRLFASSEFDKVFVCDSDLIVHESCLRCIREFNDELVSSLYNSCFHKVDKQYGGYCTKADIGWAGALIDKSIVRELLDRFGSKPFDDWALCDLAKRRNLTIKVATPSAIEHIGVAGMNNVIPEFFDHSFDFPREYIDEATRDFFLERHGFDLLRHLETYPENMTGDELRVFSVAPPKGIEGR